MDIQERNRIVEHYQNGVWWIINKNRRLITALRLEDDDVYQELMIALIKAVDSYKPERGKLEYFIFMKLQYTILNLKKKHKPYGLTHLYGAQPEVQSIDYIPEGGSPFEIPYESDFTSFEMMEVLDHDEAKAIFKQIEGMKLQNDNEKVKARVARAKLRNHFMNDKTNSNNSITKDGKKMKNTLVDLNNYLFEQIERLQNDELDDAGLEHEIRRSEAVQKVAKTIIDNGSLALQAKKHLDEYGQGDKVELPMLGITATVPAAGAQNK